MQVLRLYAARRVARCPVCGSASIILDYTTGELVCRSCGTVIEEHVFDYSYGEFSTAPTAEPSRARRGFRVSDVGSARALARLAKIVGAEGAERLLRALARERPENLLQILNNKCIQKIIKRLGENERAAVLHIAYLHSLNSYPLPTEIAESYNIPKKRVTALARKVRKCLYMEEAADQLKASPL